MADGSPWPQIVGTALGGVLTIAGGFLAQRMTTGREREARRHEAGERLKRQKAEFQVKTLLEVQEAAWHVHEAGQWFLEDALKRATNPMGSSRSPIKPETLESFQKWVPRLILLTARVDDAGVRNTLEGLIFRANEAMRFGSGGGPEANTVTCHEANVALLETFHGVNNRIGEILRELT